MIKNTLPVINHYVRLNDRSELLHEVGLCSCHNGHDTVRGKVCCATLLQLFQAVTEPPQGRMTHPDQPGAQSLAVVRAVNEDPQHAALSGYPSALR